MSITPKNERARRFIGSIAIGVVVGVGAAMCSATSHDDDTTAPATTTVTDVAPAVLGKTTAPKTTTVAPSTVDEVFLEVIGRAGLPKSKSSISAGKSTCEALDAGNTIDDVISIALEHFTPQQAGTFVGASIAAYCPNYEAALDAALGADPA